MTGVCLGRSVPLLWTNRTQSPKLRMWKGVWIRLYVWDNQQPDGTAPYQLKSIILCQGMFILESDIRWRLPFPYLGFWFLKTLCAQPPTRTNNYSLKQTCHGGSFSPCQIVDYSQGRCSLGWIRFGLQQMICRQSLLYDWQAPPGSKSSHLD